VFVGSSAGRECGFVGRRFGRGKKNSDRCRSRDSGAIVVGMLISDGGHKNGWGFEVVQLPQVAVGRFSAAVRILFLFAWPGAPVLEMEIAGALA
jgi:hypothetical protein